MPPAGSTNNPAISPELQQAIMARVQSGGMPTPTLSQTNDQAPPTAPQMPSPQGMPSQPSAPNGIAQPPPAESELIVKALDQRLRALSKIQQGGGSQTTQSMPVGF